MELTCIRCPMGCTLRVELKGDTVLSVRGNSCPQGEDYARSEAVAPVRTVTSSVLVRGGLRPVVAVKTVPPVPKCKMGEVMAALRALELQAPVHAGDVLWENIAGTGCRLVASADC